MFKINIKKFFWFLLLILPFMDTLNGLINNGGNEGGLSLGIVYRFIVFLLALYLWIKGSIKKKSLIFFGIVLVAIIISILIGISHIFEYTNRLFRLLLPMILVLSIESQSKSKYMNNEYCHSLFMAWSLLFPLTIIIPYVFGFGFNTYGIGGVGYKGFYFAQNDIGYILAALYLFMIFEIAQSFSLKKLIYILILLRSNFLLGLKSNYILVTTITIYYLFITSKKHKPQLSKLFVVLSILSSVIVIFNVYGDAINKIIMRWNYFYNSRDFMSFWTSARWDRVEPAYDWLKNTYGFLGVLFGTGLEYTYHTMDIGVNIIEMDALDVFFQMGCIGLIAVYGFYFRIQKVYKTKGFYFFGFYLSIVSGLLAGHVMESALSGIFFAMICNGGIIDYHERIISYEKQNNTV